MNSLSLTQIAQLHLKKAADPLVIPGSDSVESLYSQRLFVGQMISGTVFLDETSITGLDTPTESDQSVSKNYVDNRFRIAKSTSLIEENQNITYTGAQIIGGFIQRDLLDADRTDKFPTGAEIIEALDDQGAGINTFQCIVQNMSTLEEYDTLTIDLFQVGINVISGPSDVALVAVNPFSLVIFRGIVNDTEGTVDVYYYRTFVQNLSDNFFKGQNGLQINAPVKMDPVFSQKIDAVTKLNTGSYTAAEIINTILTRTGTFGAEQFPTATAITTALGLTTITNTWSFSTVIRNKTGGTITITANTGVTLDTSITINNNEAATLLTRYNGTGYVVYILKITLF